MRAFWTRWRHLLEHVALRKAKRSERRQVIRVSRRERLIRVRLGKS